LPVRFVLVAAVGRRRPASSSASVLRLDGFDDHLAAAAGDTTQLAGRVGPAGAGRLRLPHHAEGERAGERTW